MFLVRRPERRDARNRSFETLRELAGGGLRNPQAAQRFANASLDMAREDYPSELGALKIFNPRAAGPEAEQQAIGRMHNEIAILKQNRPGLLKLLDSNEDEGWIVTEYCHQGTLERHLSKYKGNAKLAFKAFSSLVHIVAELHKGPVVHRDIKPQNIFIGSQDELLLGDFGIVFLPDQPERLSLTGESVGPRDFMPPWVLRDDRPTINPTFDVYMLGKVLWCMATGKLKLHREDFREPQFDVSKLYPHDPDMHMINDILEKCIVPREKDCLSSALGLLPIVRTLAYMAERDRQIWRDGIPRPCRICGIGSYEPQYKQEGEPSASMAVALNRFVNNVDQHIAVLRMKPFICDRCGHVQLFKA